MLKALSASAVVVVSMLGPGTAAEGTAADTKQCVVDLREIDAALAAAPSLSGKRWAEVRDIRAQGATLCANGQEAEAEAVLLMAKAILNLS